MITKEEVQKLAKLSRLKFDDTKLEEFAKQLTNIENMIDELKVANCDGAEPLACVHSDSLRMREDKVTQEDIREDLFQNVPGKDADFAKEIKCFVVPKVVE